MKPYNHMENVMEEGHSSDALTLPHSERNSPWKALSLINLHCERLLNEEDVEMPSFSLGLSSSRGGHSNGTFTTAAPGVKEGGVTEGPLAPSLQLCEGQKSPTSVCTFEDLKGSCDEVVSDAVEGCSRKTETADLLKSGVNKSMDLIQRCPFNLNARLTENALQQKHIPICFSTQITPSSSSMEDRNNPKPAEILDHNANVTFPTEQPCKSQLPPAGADLSLISNTTESNQLISAQAHKLERRHPTNEENEAAADNSTSPRLDLLTATAPERRRERNDEKDEPCTNKCRPKTQRKQPHPSRSADIQDPGFQGVAFRIEAELDDNREQCRLLITSKYSKELCQTGRKPKLRTRTSQRLAKTSSSDEENDQMAHKGKICASCCTRKTPMWRDAENGTPLCNACGIRYKKYRVRCVKCWLIPRKEGNSSLLCMRCGNCVKLTSSAQRKHPI
ncbi:GATA-type zinc finger protein 1 [Cyprinodon tularosa]|uniref:GATA-type zinc finger protein 1 n=1 Tax=Cyprinodon tularosa TaxID=77115 RepID=UPI0018E25B70|nr:GATA-type zinc finger protein 1 [Cyprinodon tularosa]